MKSESSEKLALVPSNVYDMGVCVATVTESMGMHGSGTVKIKSLSLYAAPTVILNVIVYVSTSA